MEVVLTVLHRINGIPYGPGPVRIKANLARQLLESEQRVQDNERRFLEPRAAIIQLNYYGVPIAKRVDPRFFNDEWLRGNASVIQPGR